MPKAKQINFKKIIGKSYASRIKGAESIENFYKSTNRTQSIEDFQIYLEYINDLGTAVYPDDFSKSVDFLGTNLILSSDDILNILKIYNTIKYGIMAVYDKKIYNNIHCYKLNYPILTKQEESGFVYQDEHFKYLSNLSKSNLLELYSKHKKISQHEFTLLISHYEVVSNIINNDAHQIQQLTNLIKDNNINITLEHYATMMYWYCSFNTFKIEHLENIIKVFSGWNYNIGVAEINTFVSLAKKLNCLYHTNLKDLTENIIKYLVNLISKDNTLPSELFTYHDSLVAITNSMCEIYHMYLYNYKIYFTQNDFMNACLSNNYYLIKIIIASDSYKNGDVYFDDKITQISYAFYNIDNIKHLLENKHVPTLDNIFDYVLFGGVPNSLLELYNIHSVHITEQMKNIFSHRTINHNVVNVLQKYNNDVDQRLMNPQEKLQYLFATERNINIIKEYMETHILIPDQICFDNAILYNVNIFRYVYLNYDYKPTLNVVLKIYDNFRSLIVIKYYPELA